ncbi:MAG TPA: ABC transporter permease [Blastocatellia bacterium]|nr:ABC transporter permease [Blastocatellia bacterium]
MLKDILYAVRTLKKSPGFTVVALLTLALGIGANATIFSVVNAVLLRGLPYPDSDRLVLVWRMYGPAPEGRNITSAPVFLEWQSQNDVFEKMAIFDSAGRGYNVSGVAEPEQVSGVRVSADFFPVLGVAPRVGRNFSIEEEQPGRDHVVILSDGLWRSQYGADPDLVGKTVKIDGEGYIVIGIMPSSFDFQFGSTLRQLWVPVGYTEGDHDRGSNSFVAIARLKSGVTVAQADARMDQIGRAIAKQYPDSGEDESADVEPFAESGRGNYQPMLVALLFAVGFVLLIACANVANLMLARGAARETEIAIRCALGAGRFRIARQQLTESLLLGIAGGVAGILIAVWSTELLVKVLPNSFHYVPFRPLSGVSIDARVLAFTFVVSCLTGLLFGLAPAVSMFRPDLNTALKEGTRGSTTGAGARLRQILIAVEVALALIVLAGAGLMIESMSRLLGVNPGLDTRNVLVMEISLPQKNLYYSPPDHEQFGAQMRERVGSLPGVVSVSAISHLPLSGAGAGRGFTVEGQPDPGDQNQPGASYSVTLAGYFATMGIPLVAGREFTDEDTAKSPGVLIINEAMARRYWPDEDPVGRRIKLGKFNSDAPWLTIVGVARDVKRYGLDRRVGPEFFRPYNQAAWPFMTIVVRTAAAPGELIGSIKQAIATVEPDRPVSSVETMDQVLLGSVSSRRFPMLLLMAFGFLALLLAAVGIAGVVSHSVTMRTREIGIRLALGAQKSNVLRLVVSKSMVSVVAGVVLGLAGAYPLTRFLVSLLYEVKPMDPWVLCSVAIVLAAVALIASYIPARRATKVDPMVALRYE